MLVDLNALRRKLKEALPEDTVDATEVNPYLLNEVFRPMLAGRNLCYGDIDFDAFQADDLRMVAHYCNTRNQITYGLQEMVGRIAKAFPAACSIREFC